VRRPQPSQGWLVTVPVLYLLALLIFPIVLIAAYSVFLLTNETGMVATFSYQNWHQFFPTNWTHLPWRTASPFWNTFVRSMGVTLLISVVTTVLAYPVAYFLAFGTRRRRYVLLLVLLAPFFTSFLLRVVAWQVMLNNNGVINSALWELHLRPHGDSVPWLINTWFSVGLVLAYSWVPFVALPIFVGMENLDHSLLEAASDLGAGRLVTFWRVTFPLSLPGVIAGFVFVLIPTTGEFIAPLLVGGTDSYMFGNAIQSLFSASPDWNFGSVLALWLVGVVIILMLIFGRYLSADLQEVETSK
jgi:spermidine/putrescine transport system permease protein